MILVYASKPTSRIRYVAGLLFGSLLGSPWRVTSEHDALDRHEGPKVYYGTKPSMGKALHIPSHGLLQERGVRPLLPELFWQKELPCLFPCQGYSKDIGFDLFSATFYLVSRYEEYLPHQKDRFGRFEALSSYAFQQGFLNQAVVNRYALLLKSLLQKEFPTYPLKSTAFSFIPTYDLDVAYAYKGRGGVRTLFGGLRALWQRDLKAFSERLRVLAGSKKDPFDSYDHQLSLSRKHRIKAFYFLLCGDYGPYDRGIPFSSQAFYLLAKKLSDYAYVGLHPSYVSNGDEQQLQTEISRLKAILQEEVRFSRQHYLKLDLPNTYQHLLKRGVTHDFSMGYASQPGFRAGIASPFLFYDLDIEKVTPLTIVPFAFMDGTLRDYLGLSPEKAWLVIEQLLLEVSIVGGSFVSLWHNDALGESPKWAGWQSVHDRMYDMAVQKHQQDYDPVCSA